MRLAPLGLSLGLLLPATAAAQGSESPAEAARRGLVARGDEARRDGDHDRALSLYTRAGELRMTPSLRQMLAYEHHALGQALEAYDHASRCLSEAAPDREIRERERIVETCSAIVRRYRGRVGLVVVRAPQPRPAGLRVFVQSREVPPDLWAAGQPVLPGAAVVEARDDEGGTFRDELTLDAGATRDVTIALTRPAAVAPPRAPTPAPTPRPPTRPVTRGPGAGPWFLVVGGALAFGAAVAFGVLREEARTDRTAACPRRECQPEALDHQARFVTYTWAANAALGVGALSVVGGAIWYLVRRPRLVPHAGAAVVTLPGGAGLMVSGAF